MAISSRISDNTVQDNLLVERSKKYRDLIRKLKDYVTIKRQ